MPLSIMKLCRLYLCWLIVPIPQFSIIHTSPRNLKVFDFINFERQQLIMFKDLDEAFIRSMHDTLKVKVPKGKIRGRNLQGGS